jgi:DNA uptake protein ComE-like DNA-binding protein
MLPWMDEGPPSSYLLLASDTPVFGSDGCVVGKVTEVLCDRHADIFDGLVLATSVGRRLLDAEQVTAIHERGVDIAITSVQVAELPTPPAERRIKYDIAAGEHLWTEVLRWLHDHLPLHLRGSDARLASAHDRLAEREKALRLAREEPRLAIEAGVGRPDLPGAYDGGIVDLNHASIEAISSLAGIDHELAVRIVEVREHIDGFASLEDMGSLLDLAGDWVERVRGNVVFLPY